MRDGRVYADGMGRGSRSGFSLFNVAVEVLETRSRRVFGGAGSRSSMLSLVGAGTVGGVSVSFS